VLAETTPRVARAINNFRSAETPRRTPPIQTKFTTDKNDA